MSSDKKNSSIEMFAMLFIFIIIMFFEYYFNFL